MMRYLLLTSFLFSQTLFAIIGPNYVDHAALSGEISHEAIEKICQRFDVTPCATSGGAMDVIRGFGFYFNVFHPITQEEARRMIVEATEIAFAAVNGYRPARPYLIEFPMSAEHVSLIFYVCDSKTFKPLYTSPLTSFSFGPGRDGTPIILYSKKQDGEPPSQEIDIKESFEEAKKIVDEERRNNPSLQEHLYTKSYKEHPEEKSEEAQGFLSWLSNLINFTGSTYGGEEKYIGPPYERKISWELDEHCQGIAKEYHLQFFRFGCFTGRPCATLPYGFSFVGSQKVDLQKARVIGTIILESILQKLNSCSELHASRIRDWNAKKYWATDPNHDIPLKKSCLKIAFWDENNDRIMPPHIAQILFLDEKMQYFTCDPKTQKLQLIFEESYSDALKFKNSTGLKK